MQIALYGSKSRRDSTPDSDIDLLVLVHEEDRAFRREIIDLASQFSLEYDVLLSPHVIGETRFEQKRGFSYYRNVARDAVQLSIRRGKMRFEPGVSLLQSTSA
jgi:predicted nucleotidyltransferase